MEDSCKRSHFITHTSAYMTGREELCLPGWSSLHGDRNLQENTGWNKCMKESGRGDGQLI